MNSKDIVFVTTWDNQVFEIDINIEVWLNSIRDLQNNWEKKIYLTKYNETLYFSNIKSEKWKTQFLNLSEPKKENRLYTEEEKENSRKIIEKAYKITFEWRKKSFIKKRDEILLQLERDEKRFWLKTTLSKLQNIIK